MLLTTILGLHIISPASDTALTDQGKGRLKGMANQKGARPTFPDEVAHRFGLVPNFFLSAREAPEVTAKLWEFAKAADFDTPMPSLFKERVSELVGLRWDMLDLAQGHLHVQRLKNGRPSVHTVRGTELRALRRLQREQRPPSPYLFTTERRTPMSAAGFRKQLAVIGGGSRTPLPHPPAHAAPWALAHGKHDTRAIQEWLGHRNIEHTTRYTGLTTHRFKDFWQRED